MTCFHCARAVSKDGVRRRTGTLVLILLACCLPAARGARAQQPGTLAEARKAFKTTLTKKVSSADTPPKPPKGVFDLVRYPSPAGKLAAYVTPDPKDGRKRPAIVWITGGTCNTIGDVWSKAPPENDQTAAAYREAGIVMMFPSLRGGNERRGFQEGFYGEVDDVVAAADYLAGLPYIDPQRIYLGGHSTGGTLALLVAECSSRFRAVISFGPSSGVLMYGQSGIPLPFDTGDVRELKLRSPMFWLHSIATPTYVFEGADAAPGNVSSLEVMSRKAPPAARFTLIKGVDHFSILAPANKVLAKKILKDKGPQASLDLTEAELDAISPGAGAAAAAARPAARANVGAGAAAAPRPAKRNAGWSRPSSGRLEWTPMSGTKGDKTIQVAIGRSNRMTGLAFDLTDAGAIRTVEPVSVSQKPPAAQANREIVTARPGYTLYGVEVDATEKVNAIRLVFARLDAGADRAVPSDTYTSDWVGTPTGAKPATLESHGKRIAGFQRSLQGDLLSGFGLALVDEAPAAPAVAPGDGDGLE